MKINLEINSKLVEKILTIFIKEEVLKTGLKKVVLGLSGGVDSSLSAFLAVKALGKENVCGIIMPYKISSKESLDDALEVVKALGIQHKIIEITPMIDSYFSAYPDASNLRRGNKMARERMTILYDHSAFFSSLVLGTSNKTELLLGYGTLYGDMASAINPLGDLYKTQIWQLAEYIGVPERIVKKIPSADLWAGQSDEGELGFTYREVDRLLYCMVDLRMGEKRLIEAGFKAGFVKKIKAMIQNSQYKRRPPVIAKLSGRTIDRDFRYARDWGK